MKIEVHAEEGDLGNTMEFATAIAKYLENLHKVTDNKTECMLAINQIKEVGDLLITHADHMNKELMIRVGLEVK